MAEQLMIKCDNPKCESVGLPEHVPLTPQGKRSTQKGERVMAPYGWHQGDGWVQGSGPSYTYMACSDACVGPAVEDLVYMAREVDRDG
jgi:hypothetical protein